jgi:hypothetical protein
VLVVVWVVVELALVVVVVVVAFVVVELALVVADVTLLKCVTLAKGEI